ncbi:hypothetical protein [Streptomyces milbemycinicus]|uniref:Uncharacterized protein n=1 Tax=Streptomyces milbemycinicus TaxID=476552 RepID=A0ABW8LLV7_9ACTN
MTVTLEGERLAEVARRLRDADTGGWRQPALRALVSSLGWEWREAAGDAGEAWLRPTGRYESDFVHDGEEFVGLHVPVELVAGGATAKAESFRRAAETLTEAFGRASIMGAYGDLGPFYESTPVWGSPFLRWRGKPDTLELRAGERGPELLLQPTDPAENWFWRQGHGEAHAIGGFFGSRRVSANGGLGFPGYWQTDDWDVYTSALSDFLGSLPAETSALGIGLDLGIHALVPGTYGPVVFHIVCGDQLEIVYSTEELDGAGPGTDPASLGWIPEATAPARLSHWIDWTHHSGVFGPDDTDGPRLARLLVDTLRGLGVSSPKDLSLSDHAQTVDDYQVDFYGLTLRENP